MASLPPYRTGAEAEAALVVAVSGPFLTHKINGPEEAHALSVLLDFGLGQLYPDTTGQMSSHFDAGSILGKLPWKLIVSTVVELLISQLQNK